MEVKMESTWKAALAGEFEKPYFTKLAAAVKQAYLTQKVYPPPQTIFAAFELCPLPNVKVVIVGQDPYHGPGQAHGLAFSVKDGVEIPPSLRNIFKEIASDIGTTPPRSGDLSRLAAEGVLLLNSTLTVRAGQAGSHQSFGWEIFTEEVIKTVSRERDNVVFMLWGSFAQSKRHFIDEDRHLILTAPHPSPLSAHRGFFGSRHFSAANDYLVKHQQEPINW